MTQAEQDFLEQLTRKKLVDWCEQTLVQGSFVGEPAICLELAVGKGWVSKNEPRRVLAKGFTTAEAFLKR